MSQDSKMRTIGAKKAPQPLTMSALVLFAEKVIRTDKDAAMRAQNSVGDLAEPSNDRKTTPRISRLNELCNKSGSVKLVSSVEDDFEDDSEPTKLIAFGQTKEKK